MVRKLETSRLLFAKAILDESDDDDIQLRPFHDFFREVAENENRVVWTLGRKPESNEPFQLIEYYCADPVCDCNRVIVAVLDREDPGKGTIASIGYAFNRNDPDPGPYLDPLNPTTAKGREIYPFIANMLNTDSAYVGRLKRHYEMVKKEIKKNRKKILH